jgi:hypothetical protein
VETSERSSDGQTSETRLGDRAVNDPLLAEAVEKALGDLVSAAVSAAVLVNMLLPCRNGPLSTRASACCCRNACSPIDVGW